MTNHIIYNSNSNDLSSIQDRSIALVVTSPPYPMIEMWDNSFAAQNHEVLEALKNGDAKQAFILMHNELNKTWDEIHRVIIDGGIVCINIGDATRNIGGNFQLFSNHTMIIDYFVKNGYQVLPDIIWRKQTNSPNKFMGSGMYPPGAYVTYEHEYILIFRKGGKRIFESNLSSRQQSAYFWEERNRWFSDVWEIKGIKQKLTESDSRARSGAFPLELAYRLVLMFSIKGDTVLDPFLGTGTTTLAAIMSERSSIGYEIESQVIKSTINTIDTKEKIEFMNSYIKQRLIDHIHFCDDQISQNRPLLYKNIFHDFPVKTKQEIKICFSKIDRLVRITSGYTCYYTSLGNTAL